MIAMQSSAIEMRSPEVREHVLSGGGVRTSGQRSVVGGLPPAPAPWRRRLLVGGFVVGVGPGPSSGSRWFKSLEAQAPVGGN